MYPHLITQWAGQSIEDLATQVLYTGLPPRDVGVILYTGAGLPIPPISGEAIVAVVALRQLGFL